jgi:hypothetical protein
MAKFDASPLFDTVGKFTSVEELNPKTDRNTTDKKKYQLSFVPQSTLVNGRGVIDSTTAESLGIFLKMKVDSDTWTKLAPLLQNKLGQFFHLKIATESYSIGDNAGVWYRFHNLEPCK